MFKLQLARKDVNSEKNKELFGYNYYLIYSSGENKIIKSEIIYSSVGLANPTNQSLHDTEAANIYDNIKNDSQTQNLKSPTNIQKFNKLKL